MDLHGCAGWPGSILMTKANNIQFQQGKGQRRLKKTPVLL